MYLSEEKNKIGKTTFIVGRSKADEAISTWDCFVFLRRMITCIFSIYFMLFSIDVYAAMATSSKPLNYAVIADFDKKDLFNNLGGDSGTWEMDPSDNEQSCKASIDFENSRGRGGGCLKLEYDTDSPKIAINGFWTQLQSFDANSFDHLDFFVKGDKEKGHTATFKIEVKKVKSISQDGKYEYTKGNFIVTGVTDAWQRISIPLHKMVGIEESWQDWSRLKELVISFESRRLDKKAGIIYIDDMRFVRTGNPGPSIRDDIPRKAKTKQWITGEDYARFLIKRLGGFPEKIWVKKEFPEDNYAFLMTIAKDMWKYFDKIVDTEYGLPLDYIKLGDEKAISDKTAIGDYTNITNIGLYLMCIVSAYDFGFITKEEAIKRISLTLDSIETLESYNGFLYNYYDVTNFQRTSHFISLVDSGWLTTGLVVVKNAFPEEIGKRCSKLIDQRNFSFFYDFVQGHMYHGYYVNVDSYSGSHYGIFYSESRAISYMAIGKGDVPIEHWFMLQRTFPESWAWQTQIPKERKEKEYLGYKFIGGYYTYNGYKYIPSWGGSMFEALMPTLIIDEKDIAPKGLGLNDKVHAELQIKITKEKLNYPVWGQSPSTTPIGGYTEYGITQLGIKGYKQGVITPHATFLALEFMPKEAVENLRNLIKLYNIYGEYGFYDSLNIETKLVAPKYLCLDQAMSFIALNNFLNNGAIRKRFHKDELNLEAEKLLKIEDLFN